MALNKYHIQDAVGQWVVLVSNDEANSKDLLNFNLSCPAQIRQYPNGGKFVLTRKLTDQDIQDEDFCQYLISVWDTEDKLAQFIESSALINEN